jgi:hypothetical protein
MTTVMAKFEISIRKDIPQHKVTQVLEMAAERLEKILPHLNSIDRCTGFLMGAEQDGIKLPSNWRDLDFDSMKVACIKAWWLRVERVLNEEMTFEYPNREGMH